MNEKTKLNLLVTVSHICLALAFTITQTLIIFRTNVTQTTRMLTAFYFFGGAADLFLSLMLWFILNDDKVPFVYLDGARVYAIEEVSKQKHSTNSYDCEDDEHDSEPVSGSNSIFSGSSSSLISRRMIEQFFKQVEGPDRNWK